MSSKTTTTAQYTQPAATPASTALATMVDQGSDPSIPYAYAQQREDIDNSYQNPLGAATSPAVRDASNRIANQRLSTLQNTAVQASDYQNNQAAFGREATVAGFQQPVQSGSTSVTPFNPASLIAPGISAGAGIGEAAML